MNNSLPTVYLVRHGETAWSLSGQHTGRTNLPLLESGERAARQLSTRLAGLNPARVFTSPLERAKRTCSLAGFGPAAMEDADLMEWNYGQYEGLTSAEIHTQRPDWQIFRDGCPGGESPAEVATRADAVVQRIRAIKGDVMLFSSGHFLRMLTARWLGLDPLGGMYFLLGTASVSALSYESIPPHPAVRYWNDTRHVEAKS